MTEQRLSIAQLYELQAVDRSLDALQHEKEQPPEALEVERLQKRVNKMNALVKKIEEATERTQRNIRRLELDLQAIEERIEKNEQLMFDGSTRDMRELSGLQDQVEADRTKKETIEEQLLGRMERLEELDGNQEQSHRVQGDEKNKLKRATEQWQRIQKDRLDEIKRLDERRQHLIARIPKDALERYELMKQKMDRPVSKVIERTCRGCHVTLPTSVTLPKDDQLSFCPRCSRILYPVSSDD